MPRAVRPQADADLNGDDPCPGLPEDLPPPAGPPLASSPDKEPAAAITRGVCRLFAQMGLSPLTELTLANGRRVDVAGLGRGGEIVVAEVKSSLADFRADGKWADYLPFCDRFFFAVAADFPLNVLPPATGLIVADRFGGSVLRESPVTKLAAGRRKAVTLRFATVAADRLARACDPEAY